MSIEKSKQSVHSRGIGVINHVLPDEGQGGGREVEKQEGQGVRPCAWGNGSKTHFIQRCNPECDSGCKVICDTMTSAGPHSMCVLFLWFKPCVTVSFSGELMTDTLMGSRLAQTQEYGHYCSHQKSCDAARSLMDDGFWNGFQGKMISKCISQLRKWFLLLLLLHT